MKTVRHIAIGVGVLLFSGSHALAQQQEEQASASADLSVTAVQRARQIAEGTPRLRTDLSTFSRWSRRAIGERMQLLRSGTLEPRIVFVDADALDEKETDNADDQLLRVRHYRYSDDTVITSIVDLEGGRVVQQAEAQHAAVPLTQSELDEARTIALAEPAIAAALAPYVGRLTVEPLVVRTRDRSDPWFGRRVVRLLFRNGRNYLRQPVVYVDLSQRRATTVASHSPSHGDRR